MSYPKVVSGPVPQKDPNLAWVETLDAGAKVRVKVYSPAIWGLWTHFNGRTKPCFENHELCEGGHDEETLRWYGYIFGFHYGLNRCSFLQLTAAAARQWFEQIAPGVSLRGMVVDVSRTASKKGRVNLKVAEYMSSSIDSAAKDKDPHASVFKLWKVNHLGGASRYSLVSGPADVPDDLLAG